MNIPNSKICPKGEWSIVKCTNRLSLSKDRAYQEEKVVRRQANIQELVTLKDSERRLIQELEKTKEQLRNEQLKYREATQKVNKRDTYMKSSNIFDNILLNCCMVISCPRVTGLLSFSFTQLTREEQNAIQGV